jgi:hypothetical protein
LNEDSLLDILIEDLTSSSSMQESDNRARQDLLARAQSVSLELWKISSTKIPVALRCLDEVLVTSYVDSQSIDFNQDQANLFQGVLRKIHEINTSSAADSLFSQTANEIALSRLIHHYYLSGNIKSLKVAFAHLSQTIGHSSRLSPQTIDVLRGLLYFSGLAISKSELSPQQAANPIINQNNDLLLDLTNLTSPPPTSSLSSSTLDEEPLSLYLLRHLIDAQSLQWASALLSPSMDDVLIHHWLAIAFDPKHLSSMQEIEMIKIVSQIPWSQMANMGSNTVQIDLQISSRTFGGCPSMNPSNPKYIESIKNGILLPIQNAISAAAGKNYVALIVLLSKILALVSRTAPSALTATCVGILMRGPWPAKMVAIPSLQLFDWNMLDASTLVLLFGELYHLFQRKPIEYASSSTRQMKLEHRDQFANFIVSNQPMMAVTYQVDPNLAQANFQRSYPIFFILAQIALTALRIQKSPNQTTFNLISGSQEVNNQGPGNLPFDLPRVIAEELFHFAAAWIPVSNTPNYQYQRSAQGLVRAEAHDALQRICQEEPRLYSHVMLELLHNMSMLNFDLNVGIKQLQPQLMIVDDNLINSVAFLMCRRSFEALPPHNSPNYRMAASSMAEAIMSDATERVTDHLGWPVATHIFSNVLWHNAPPLFRAKAIMLLVSLHNVKGAPPDANGWILTMLARLLSPSVVSHLGSLPIDLLLNQLQHLPNDSAAAITVRIVTALNAVRNAITRPITASNNGASESSNRFNFSWLWDSFKLKSLLDQLFVTLKKLPNTPVTVAKSRHLPSSSLTRSSKPMSLFEASDALNSIAASATNSIFGLQTSQASSSQVQRASTTTTTTTMGRPNHDEFVLGKSSIQSTNPLLLMQRVVYHYAHCIKHSTGQLQREVSVLFNVLIDQLESFQKGSGFQVLEELFNESMGPVAGASGPLDPSQAELRGIWLNFWVYALVPRLLSWSSSTTLTTILDAFAYTAFFSSSFWRDDIIASKLKRERRWSYYIE